MRYADYEYYKDTYKGRLSEADYEYYSQRAGEYIDYISLARARLWGGDEVKRACCAVAEVYALNESGGGVASETVGGWTRNYIAGTSIAKTEEQRLYNAARLHLAYTGLLYRGMG